MEPRVLHILGATKNLIKKVCDEMLITLVWSLSHHTPKSVYN
jgi:hypothetical protein